MKSRISISASKLLLNGPRVHSQISYPNWVSHSPSSQHQLGLARPVGHPSSYFDVVTITADSKHAFYSFAVAVRAQFRTAVGAKDFKTEHSTCFEPLKLFESAVTFAPAAGVFGGSMESASLRPFVFCTGIF